MRVLLTVVSWIAIIFGFLALVGSISTFSVDPEAAGYAVLGGILFFFQGLISLLYIKKMEG